MTMKTILSMVLVALLAGCQAATFTKPNDIEFQAGGRDADFIAETYYSKAEGGGVKSRCAPNLKSANNYPLGIDLTVTANENGLCSVVLKLPKVDPSEAATSNAIKFEVDPAMLNAVANPLIGALVNRLMGPPQ